jgi:pyruvate/2-oxoglutarate dehydrogenase complex dihydrolipoamide acyltransferase (E2) component
MSAQLRDRPKWADNAIFEAETQMLSRLEAGAALMRLIVQASTVNAQAMLEEHAAATQTPVAQEAAPVSDVPTVAPEAVAPKKPKAKRSCFPRVHAPQMMALGQRAAELLADLAPLVRNITQNFIRAGIDPRPTLRRAASMQVAHVFADELGIDLENVEQASFEQLQAALKRVQEWIIECRRGEVVLLSEAAQSEGTGPPDANGVGQEEAPKPDPVCESGEEQTPGRTPATYSAGPESLDWTKT